MRAIMPIIAAAMVMAACSGKEQSHYANVPASGWAYGAPYVLEADTTDTCHIKEGSIAVALRHTNNYEYSNIWLQVSYTDADTLRTDTCNIILADVYGAWHGTGVGVGYQLVDTVLRHVTVDRSKDITLTHIMRTDTLREIEQIGIIFTPDP